MLKTNRATIVEFLLQCQPGPPRTSGTWKVDHLGQPFLLPGIGGITLNLQVGDSAFGLAGDHIEPGVSCTADTHKPDEHPNNSLQLFACVGNRARVATGDAKGEQGWVLGHHGGSEHVIVDFPRAVKERLTYDDRILIHAQGQGLRLLEHPGITLFNLDPDLLDRLQVRTTERGTLEVPVTTIVPAACMGSGIGSAHVGSGDYDIMTSDPESVARHGLDRIPLRRLRGHPGPR